MCSKPRVIAAEIKKDFTKDVIREKNGSKPHIAGELGLVGGTSSEPHWAEVRDGQLVVYPGPRGGCGAWRIPLRHLHLQPAASGRPRGFSLTRPGEAQPLATFQVDSELDYSRWVRTLAAELLKQTPLEAVKYLDILGITATIPSHEQQRCLSPEYHSEPECRSWELRCSPLPRGRSTPEPPRTAPRLYRPQPLSLVITEEPPRRTSYRKALSFDSEDCVDAPRPMKNLRTFKKSRSNESINKYPPAVGDIVEKNKVKSLLKTFSRENCLTTNQSPLQPLDLNCKLKSQNPPHLLDQNCKAMSQHTLDKNCKTMSPTHLLNSKLTSQSPLHPLDMNSKLTSKDSLHPLDINCKATSQSPLNTVNMNCKVTSPLHPLDMNSKVTNQSPLHPLDMKDDGRTGRPPLPDVVKDLPPCDRRSRARTRTPAPLRLRGKSVDVLPNTEDTRVAELIARCQQEDRYVPVRDKRLLFESLGRASSTPRFVLSSDNLADLHDVGVPPSPEPPRTQSLHDLSNNNVAVKEICRYFEQRGGSRGELAARSPSPECRLRLGPGPCKTLGPLDSLRPRRLSKLRLVIADCEQNIWRLQEQADKLSHNRRGGSTRLQVAVDCRLEEERDRLKTLQDEQFKLQRELDSNPQPFGLTVAQRHHSNVR